MPPPLRTSEAGSFARDTLARRVPEILADTRRRLEPVPAEVARKLDELMTELRGGSLRGLEEPAPDRAAWDAAVAPHVGRSWLDLPWYFAEAFFYRRLLEATGYFGTGPLAGQDPFASHKAEEWRADEGPRRTVEALRAAPGDREGRLRARLRGSLWGNRADLSYNVARLLGSFAGGAEDLVIDRSDEIVAFAGAAPLRDVVVILDNAGTELLMDLALAVHLADDWRVPRVEVHAKDHPFFVSDTVPSDVDHALASLEASGFAEASDLARRFAALRASGAIALETHPFYTSSLHFPELPNDLRARLRAADLVILKGDANYRRLCSDAHWPPTTPFAEVVAEFPAPLVTLRTLKAEVIVGLPPGLAERLAAEDPAWLTNGRRGLIDARLHRPN